MNDGLRPRDVTQLTVGELAARLESLSVLPTRLLRALEADLRSGVRQLAVRTRTRIMRVEREAARLRGLRRVEDEQRELGFLVIAGVDEAGVAPLAGPVVAAAVVPPEGFTLTGLDDSKRLTRDEREALYPVITGSAVTSVGIATVDEIDRLNVLQATRLAHRRAILGLPERPQLVLIDGRYHADVALPQLVIVDGDATCACIAAASIVAKVTRDRLMADLALQYPGYGFERHKGYGTRSHCEAIERLGLTPAHRRSFTPVRGRNSLSTGPSPRGQCNGV